MSARRTLKTWAQDHVSQLALAPTGVLALVFVYGFILLTIYLSLTDSRILPSYNFVGFEQWERLWGARRWWTAVNNLLLFGSLFIGFAIAIGMALAVFLDQRVRAEGVIRTIYLYPMALSFIVTGTAWKWMLNPDLGIEQVFQQWGWTSFQFNWLVQKDMAIYTVVIAAVWQSSGFVMAIFLAALRGIDASIMQSAMVDGASMFRIYRRIILPQLRPAMFTAFVLLLHMAIKSFDLVIALTNGGPGNATDLPATFMYTFAFERSRLGIAAASATMMLFTVVAIIVPYLYAELRAQNRDRRD
ncbi:carbohydrate ABC transporter permease [Ruegeria sp. EL01]|jgi:glucose/mannose transport system permease protein|uniref:carbohydrate ABC transporter permease n=1 Tax=Ruegeria sp. EL01 TaxID=2107578 RepID=UPI000EA837B2|nr:sugar ABC transporter permease [Ruegeria sp. EL01]